VNVWTDWVAPALVLLCTALVGVGVIVARRDRTRAEATSRAAHALAVDGLAELQMAAVTYLHHPGPDRHDPPRLGPFPEHCANGEHRWARRDVSNVRRPGGDDGEPLRCSVTWRCGDCPAVRHEQNVPPPLSLVAVQAAMTPTVAARSGVPGAEPATPLVSRQAIADEVARRNGTAEASS
jgi:hypothetical protein